MRCAPRRCGCANEDPDTWPDLLLWVGDQIYADEVSPETREVHRGAGAITDEEPGCIALDFEEYSKLYYESWNEPVTRWLLSTVSSAMIFDDHDVHDDWNTSAAWVEEIRKTDWWDERVVAGLMSYWIYQHVGNLDPGRAGRERSARPPAALGRRHVGAARVRTRRRPRGGLLALELPPGRGADPGRGDRLPLRPAAGGGQPLDAGRVTSGSGSTTTPPGASTTC